MSLQLKPSTPFLGGSQHEHTDLAPFATCRRAQPSVMWTEESSSLSSWRHWHGHLGRGDMTRLCHSYRYRGSPTPTPPPCFTGGPLVSRNLFPLPSHHWAHMQLFTGVLGTQTWVFTFARQTLDSLSHLPSPRLHFLRGPWILFPRPCLCFQVFWLILVLSLNPSHLGTVLW